MILSGNHPLANLGDGFRLTDCPTVANFPVSKFSFQEPEPPKGPRPIREVIPYTKGRLETWKLLEHVRSAKARNWPGLKPHEFKGQAIAICGGGPSLSRLDQIKELRAIQKKGGKVLAINRTHDWLFTKGIAPWGGILLDPVPAVASYMTPRRGVRYYVGSQCHPSTFDNFDKPDVQKIIWHATSVPELQDELNAHERLFCVPANGSTCGLRAILLAYIIGFREIHLFGFDSCFEQNAGGSLKVVDQKPVLHAYPKPEAIHQITELTIPYPDGQKKYFGNTMMLAQADEFQEFLMGRDKGLTEGMLERHDLFVHGSGLIPDIARFYGLHSEQRKKVNNERLHA